MSCYYSFTFTHVVFIPRLIDQISFIQVDYINTSHPNFLGGNKAAELAMQLLKSPQVSANSTLDMMQHPANLLGS